MANTEIHTSWPKHMVKPHDKREPVNIHNTYLILVQGLVQNHYCGFPELLNYYKQLDEVFVISRIIKVEVRLDEVFVISRIIKAEVRVIKYKGYQPKLKAEANNPYQNLDYSGYHKN